jgi:hypothetical protein
MFFGHPTFGHPTDAMHRLPPGWATVVHCLLVPQSKGGVLWRKE